MSGTAGGNGPAVLVSNWETDGSDIKLYSILILFD